MSKYWKNLTPPEHNGRLLPSGSFCICSFCGHVVKIGEKHACRKHSDEVFVFDMACEPCSYDRLKKFFHLWSDKLPGKCYQYELSAEIGDGIEQCQ